MGTIEEIRAKVRCSACHGKIAGRINLVELRRRATWDYPCSGNVITGEHHVATAVCCDACIKSKREIVEAVEFAGDQVVYHPVIELEELPPPQEFALIDRDGTTGIHCLRCGMVSWNPNDVYYQIRFHSMRGRWPTWSDAMAHCTPEVRSHWRQCAIEIMREQGLDVPADLLVGELAPELRTR